MKSVISEVIKLRCPIKEKSISFDYCEENCDVKKKCGAYYQHVIQIYKKREKCLKK